MENKYFSEKEYEKTYNFIKQILLNKKEIEKYPNATLIGGQPGSGKSQLTKYILSQNQNTIVVDGDYIREFHPHITQIKDEYKETYPKITQPFVNRVVEQLIDELSKKHYNMIIEGTLRDVNIPIKTARMLDERDYIVELLVVATDRYTSWKSTIDRGDKMREEGKIPRYVDKNHHDFVVEKLPDTVQKLIDEDSIYNIIIMRRDETIIYNKEETPDLNPKDILEKELSGIHVKSINEIQQEKTSVKKKTITMDQLLKDRIKDEPITKKDLHRSIEDDLER